MSHKKIVFYVIIIITISMHILAGDTHAEIILNVHNEMVCTKCHLADVSFDTPVNTDEVVSVKDDMMNICLSCHKDILFVHHPLRVQIYENIPEYLPLGEGNSITCITCHSLHEKDASSHLLRSSNLGDYRSKIDICYECHKDDFKEISPHKSEESGLSCLTCHRNAPTIRDTRETVTLVSKNVEKICNFCHIVNMDEHPLNVDTSIKLPDDLPRSEAGEVVCITCHDPHTTLNTINFLRESYVNVLEFGKYENPHNIDEYFNCVKCHEGIASANEYVDCRYEDDFIMLCFNCHGADQEKCHPVNISLSEGMELPDKFKLNDDGLITCVTCHNPECSEDKKIRYINFQALNEGNCNGCHGFSDKISKIDPHADGTDTESDACYYCHRRERSKNDFGMSERFICIKCHAFKEHPPGSARAFVFSNEKPGIKIDKKGKITCSTCHDPHSNDKKNLMLKVVDGMTICEACHQA